MIVRCIEKQYQVEVDMRKILDAEGWHTNGSGAYKDTLHAKLMELEGLHGSQQVDYDGHFGNYLYITIHPSYDTPEFWKQIESTVEKYLSILE